MAPTICSEKKRQLRGTLKFKRSSPQRNEAIAASSVINYIAKGTITKSSASSLRLHSNSAFRAAKKNSNSSSGSLLVSSSTSETRSLTPSAAHLSSDASCCDNRENEKVSSTTTNHSELGASHSNSNSNSSSSSSNASNEELLIRSTLLAAQSLSAAQNGSLSSMLMDIDSSDAEVHSIISNGACSRDSQQQQGRLPLQTVFNTSDARCSSTLRQIDKNNNNNNNNSYNSCNKNSRSILQHYRDAYEIKNCEGLLAIAIKTIKLVKRNQLLQKRLLQLQLETSDFIKSVLANPENKHFADKCNLSSSK